MGRVMEESRVEEKGISERIRERRMELGLTIREVAIALGTAESTVFRYETSSIQNMRIDKIVELAKVLKCTPDYLLGWEMLNQFSDYENAKAYLESNNLLAAFGGNISDAAAVEIANIVYKDRKERKIRKEENGYE